MINVNEAIKIKTTQENQNGQKTIKRKWMTFMVKKSRKLVKTMKNFLEAVKKINHKILKIKKNNFQIIIEKSKVEVLKEINTNIKMTGTKNMKNQTLMNLTKLFKKWEKVNTQIQIQLLRKSCYKKIMRKLKSLTLSKILILNKSNKTLTKKIKTKFYGEMSVLKK